MSDWTDLGPEDLPPELVEVVLLPAFASVEEPGIDAILGTLDQNLVPVGGDAMLYGDGGAGKTTLAVDLAFHVAAGADWLGILVERPRSVLLIENEGPRPLFRRKLRKKFASWDGPPLEDRLHVWQAPWAGFSFAEPEMAAQLARLIFELEIDLVIAGPVTQLGMEDAGTIREVRRFAASVALLRERSLRPVASLLVHHEAKSGRVSGAWEGVGDTMIHVSGGGNGRTRFTIQKARWGSSYHGKTYRLRWLDGQGFEEEGDDADRPARVWDAILAFVAEHPGTGWTAVLAAVGGEKTYVVRRRDQMLEEGVLVDLGKGERGSGHRFELWLAEAAPTMLPGVVSGRIGDSRRLPTRVAAERNGDCGDSASPSGEEGTAEGVAGPPLRSRGDSPGGYSPPPSRSAEESPEESPGLDQDIDW